MKHCIFMSIGLSLGSLGLYGSATDILQPLGYSLSKKEGAGVIGAFKQDRVQALKRIKELNARQGQFEAQMRSIRNAWIHRVPSSDDAEKFGRVEQQLDQLRKKRDLVREEAELLISQYNFTWRDFVPEGSVIID